MGRNIHATVRPREMGDHAHQSLEETISRLRPAASLAELFSEPPVGYGFSLVSGMMREET
jgi:hypothetical protein